MNLHEKFHCKSIGRATAEKACECADGGSWQLLGADGGAQSRALAHGFKKVCEECGELQ